MNKKIISVVMMLILTLTINVNTFAAPSTNQTSELEQAQSSKKALQIQVKNFNNELDKVLNKIDINKAKMNDISQDINKTQTKLEIVEKSAIAQEDLFEKRARAMYINSVDSYLEVLLASTSFSDLISRVDTLERIIEYDKNLIAKIEEQRTSIIKHKDTLTNENNKLSALKTNNEIILTKLSKDIKEHKVLLSNVTKKETKLIADKNAKELAAAKILKELEAIKTATMSRQLASSKSSTSNSDAIPIDLSKSTNYFIIQSTAYSMGGFTSSGSRTTRNPNGYSTIAVDPSVIPMGSKVYIEGYGYAIASDTGSAIKGSIIDVFFNTEAEVLNWGRRNVRIRIIN
ncbi:3D domain-containing protein [Clostridium tagluense]|uniref:3D domain-containing protein n=1 Tax=Clostridium tagluense TaxID=360422 RepID=UPI0027E0C74E|nr:3D domain-containing protein [Clostridium tagluense]